MQEWAERIRAGVQIYREYIADYMIEIPESGLLAGTHPVNSAWGRKTGKMQQLFQMDNMHYPMGNACLNYGIAKILEMTENRTETDTDDTAAYRSGIHEVYQAVRTYIRAHREKAEEKILQTEDSAEKIRLKRIAVCCEHLTKDRPDSFLEAMQLFWFLYLLRSPYGGGCIGRLDQKLYPFYLRDVEKGEWNREEALSVIIQFYRKINTMMTGDTLRNLMLSGQNEYGEDETNELTYLFLEAYEKTQDAEPHLNVRIHKGTPQKLKDVCVRMLAEGKGQPTIYFDENILPAMEKAGISHADACAYANDGCTETVYDGRGNIYFLQHEMVKTVELTMFNGEENPFIYLVRMKKNRKAAPEFEPKTCLITGFRSGELEAMHSFSDFLDAFAAQLEFQISKWLEIIDRKIEEDDCETLTSPFIGGTLEKCLVSGQDPLRGGGFDVENYQLLSGTISTAADCLRGVEYAVFEKKYCTLTELRDAMSADFAGYELLRQRLLHAPKFGNEDIRVNELAAWISEKFLDQVNRYRSRSGKRIQPGLYNIDFKIFANVTGATPDGRRFRDAIGEHCSPTPGAAKCGPTAIVDAASCLPMREGYAASVLHLTLDKGSFLLGAQREQIIMQLMDGSEQAGIPVWNLSMYSRDELLEAKRNPEKHQDLIVRVWGFNARFVELDEEMQDHIIARIS